MLHRRLDKNTVCKKMKKSKDLIGKQFGNWKVIGFSHKDKNRNRYWKCVCICKKEKTIFCGSLERGLSKSCGCSTNEIKKKTNNTKYGVDWGFSDEGVKQKIKQTNINKYGVEYPIQLERIKQKMKNTNFKR
ncbi:hypothetical protein LCGC14_1204780, partial [marine sediment metagenome]